MLDEIEIVKAFINAINAQDLDTMETLMTPDHTFIDGDGHSNSGIENMIPGWREYFKMFPDFQIDPECFLQNETMVAVFGSYVNTYSGKKGMQPKNRHFGTAAWKAVVLEGKIKLWQIYTDYTETWKIIENEEKGK